MAPSTHRAAVLLSKGTPLAQETLPTPSPGLDELLISVHSIALNPIDVFLRDVGVFIDSYPAVIGSDIAGVVEAVGSSKPWGRRSRTRVAAFAPAFSARGKPENGAFQTKVIVPAANAAVIPNSMSFIDAATLPTSIVTAWSGWTTLGLDYTTHFSDTDNQAVLVWGASSSVGVGAVQSAKALGLKVYATASATHHQYLRSLGASEVFDYHSPSVVKDILTTVESNAVQLQTAYFATGNLQPVLDVLARSAEGKGKVASTIPLNASTPTHPDIECKFVEAPEDQRTKHFTFVFHEWLAPRLASGDVVPAPKARVMPGSLEGLNAALDVLKAGVSGEKLVVEVAS